MNAAEALAELERCAPPPKADTDRRRRRSLDFDWQQLAWVVREVLRTNAWTGEYPSSVEWLREAQRVTGFAVPTLRRMVQALDFLISMHEQDKVPQEKTRHLPFSAVEIIKRMHDLAPEEALGELKALLGPNGPRFQDVRAKYDALVGEKKGRAGASKLVPRLARQFEELASEAVSRQVQQLCGTTEVEFVGRVVRLEFFQSSAVAVGRSASGERFVDAFDFRRVSAENLAGQRQALLYRSEFGASFFRRLWIVLSPGAGEELALGLCQDLEKLNLTSIGVITVKEADPNAKFSAAVELMPPLREPSGTPCPDRRALLPEELAAPEPRGAKSED